MLLGTNDVMACLVLFRLFEIYVQRLGGNPEQSGWDGSSSILRAKLREYLSVRLKMLLMDPVIFLPILVTLSSMFLFWSERLPPQHWMAKVNTWRNHFTKQMASTDFVTVFCRVNTSDVIFMSLSVISLHFTCVRVVIFLAVPSIFLSHPVTSLSSKPVDQ